MTPINPYLGGTHEKNEPLFTCLFHLCTLWKPHFGAKYGPRGPPRAIYEPGGQGVTETPIVLKELRSGWAGNT